MQAQRRVVDYKKGKSIFCRACAWDFNKEAEVLALFQTTVNAHAPMRLHQPGHAAAATAMPCALRPEAMPAQELPQTEQHQATGQRMAGGAPPQLLQTEQQQATDERMERLELTVVELQGQVTHLQERLLEATRSWETQAATLTRVIGHLHLDSRPLDPARDGDHQVGAGR